MADLSMISDRGSPKGLPFVCREISPFCRIVKAKGENTLMDWNNFFSGIGGTVIGGVITWFVTTRSLNKQFEYQKILLIEDKKTKQKESLLAIRYEIIENRDNFVIIKDVMDCDKENEILIEHINNSGLGVCNNKYVIHCDNLYLIENDELINNIRDFYISLKYCFLPSGSLTKSFVEELILIAEKAANNIDEYLNELNN